jgi:hypothetical protein
MRRTDLDLLSRLAVPGSRPGAAGQRGQLRDRQRPRADRPLRPPAQHQLRDRAQPAAAGRDPGAGAGAAQPAQPAAGGDQTTCRRRRGHDRAVQQLRPGHADRRVVHLHRAGAAVQGLRAAGHHPGGAGAVDSRARSWRCSSRRRRSVDAVDDRPDHADGHRHQELDPADRVRDHGARDRGDEPPGRPCWTPATSAPARS